MNRVFLLVGILAYAFTSCNNDVETPVLEKQESSKMVMLAGHDIENVNGTLSFESEDELKEVASNLISYQSTKSADGALIADYSQIQKLQENGFVSLYDIFQNALNDVDSYYDHEGGYEEMKAKYPSLFFPEVGDDISPYLPVSDRKLAMLADANGDVLIANQKVSLKDITTYQQLEDLGMTPPDGIELMVERGDVVSGTNSIPKTTVGQNKVWVNVKEDKDHSIPTIKVEVCFRKKYFLGWSNHNSNSSATLGDGSGMGAYSKTYVSCHGFSSHDYVYSVPNYPGDNHTVAVDRKVKIEHGGTGLTLDLRCQFPPRAL